MSSSMMTGGRVTPAPALPGCGRRTSYRVEATTGVASTIQLTKSVHSCAYCVDRVTDVLVAAGLRVDWGAAPVSQPCGSGVDWSTTPPTPFDPPAPTPAPVVAAVAPTDPDDAARVRMRADNLADAVLRMTIRYGEATQDYAYSGKDGSHPDERARRLRVVARRMKVMCRLTAALRDLTGGAR